MLQYRWKPRGDWVCSGFTLRLCLQGLLAIMAHVEALTRTRAHSRRPVMITTFTIVTERNTKTVYKISTKMYSCVGFQLPFTTENITH